jgi:hypothetical protein
MNNFSQNLSEERMNKYNEFGKLCNDFSESYVRLWISREPEYSNAKDKAERDDFVQRMFLKFGVAWDDSKSDFRTNIVSDRNFKNIIKDLLEQLNNEPENDNVIQQWSLVLSQNGYAVTADHFNNAYNNIQIFSYNLIFLINSCMFLDQEFPDNTITDSILKKAEEYFVQRRTRDSGR